MLFRELHCAVSMAFDLICKIMHRHKRLLNHEDYSVAVCTAPFKFKTGPDAEGSSRAPVLQGLVPPRT